MLNKIYWTSATLVLALICLRLWSGNVSPILSYLGR